MISRQQLEQLKYALGFTIWQAEKDYLQHLFLLFLSRRSKGELIFKGGTALQKAYGLGRFSIDLDFNIAQPDFDAKGLLEKIASDVSSFGYKAVFGVQDGKLSKPSFLKVEGPLYEGTEKTLSTLRIDISARETAILEPQAVEIMPIYPDMPPYFTTVMALEEILSEKIRAILSRASARDVYDLWFLLNKNVVPDFSLISKKLEYCNMKFDKKIFLDAINGRKDLWESELGQLLPAVPDFSSVRTYILSRLQNV